MLNPDPMRPYLAGPYTYVATDGTNVFVAGCNGSVGINQSEVYAFPVQGGVGVPIVKFEKDACSPALQALTRDAGHLYLLKGSEVLSVDLASLAKILLTSNVTGAQPALATDGKNVYWETYEARSNVSGTIAGGKVSILSVPIAGGTVSTVASVDTDREPVASPIAADGSYVYWFVDSTQPPEGIYAAPIGGGTPQLFASGSIYSIALDSHNVYWAALGSIFKGPRIAPP